MTPGVAGVPLYGALHSPVLSRPWRVGIKDRLLLNGPFRSEGMVHVIFAQPCRFEVLFFCVAVGCRRLSADSGGFVNDCLPYALTLSLIWAKGRSVSQSGVFST